MVIGFKPQFKYKILEGTKIHTLRDDPKNRWVAGRSMHMATGVRTKHQALFKEDTCKSTQMVTLGYDSKGQFYIQVFNDKTLAAELHGVEQEVFAKNDGFNSLEDLKSWFEIEIQTAPGKYIHKKLIHWTNFKY